MEYALHTIWPLSDTIWPRRGKYNFFLPPFRLPDLQLDSANICQLFWRRDSGQKGKGDKISAPVLLRSSHFCPQTPPIWVTSCPKSPMFLTQTAPAANLPALVGRLSCHHALWLLRLSYSVFILLMSTDIRQPVVIWLEFKQEMVLFSHLIISQGKECASEEYTSTNLLGKKE